LFVVINQSNVVNMTRASDNLVVGSTIVTISQSVYSKVLPPHNFFITLDFLQLRDSSVLTIRFNLCDWSMLLRSDFSLVEGVE